MKELLATIDAWQAQGVGIARAVVLRTYGSAPQREGAAMLLADDGRIAGSVSGGCIEAAAVGHMEEARASGRQRVVRFGVSDERAWEVGLACGGTIDVLIQPHIPATAIEALRSVAPGASPGPSSGRVLLSRLPEGSPGAASGISEVGPAGAMAEPLVVHADGRVEGSLGDGAPDAQAIAAARAALALGAATTIDLAGRQLFLEVYAPRPRLVIVGGVPVAMALVRLARELGYETVVIDGRPAFATRERFPDVDELIVGWPDEVADEIGLGPADAVAVLSHDPKFDDPAIVEALRRGCRYVGAIGSRKTQRARRGRLIERGLSAAQLEGLRGPIGLDLGGREPAETALAIMAEVVAARHGASGLPMREAEGRVVSGGEVGALDSVPTQNRPT